VKVFLLGREGKVGSVLAPALEAAGHELVEQPGVAEDLLHRLHRELHDADAEGNAHGLI